MRGRALDFAADSPLVRPVEWGVPWGIHFAEGHCSRSIPVYRSQNFAGVFAGAHTPAQAGAPGGTSPPLEAPGAPPCWADLHADSPVSQLVGIPEGRAASEAKNCQELGIEGRNRPLRGPISPSRTSLRRDRGLAGSRNPWSSQASFLTAFFVAFRTPQNFPSIPISCQISSDPRARRSRK